jgi:ribosomal protein L32
MAVPKKKISYSKTRKKKLVNTEKPNLYTQCNLCFSFLKSHRLCFLCSNIENASTQQLKNTLKTNINELH